MCVCGSFLYPPRFGSPPAFYLFVSEVPFYASGVEVAAEFRVVSIQFDVLL